MEKHNDDKFTFYFIGVIMLFIAAIMTGAILGGTPSVMANLLVPSVFGFVGLIFIVGTFLWNRRIKNDFI
jgi:hypothetical protein